MIKTYFAQRKESTRQYCSCGNYSCTSKKYEITREELTTNGQRSTDFAITTNELVLMLKSRNIDLSAKKITMTSSWEHHQEEVSFSGAPEGNEWLSVSSF